MEVSLAIESPERSPLMRYHVLIDTAEHTVELASQDAPEFAAVIDGRKVRVNAVAISRSLYSVILEGQSFEVQVTETSDGFLVYVGGREFCVSISDPRSWQRLRTGKIELEGRQKIVAPMPGKVVRVLAGVGHQVKAGQGLMVVEAMKMQNEIRSPKSGTVAEILCAEGQSVTAGDVLAVIT